MYFIRYQPFTPSEIAFGQLRIVMVWVWLIITGQLIWSLQLSLAQQTIIRTS